MRIHVISKRILLDSAIFTQCNVAKVKLLPHDKVGYYVALFKIVLLFANNNADNFSDEF